MWGNLVIFMCHQRHKKFMHIFQPTKLIYIKYFDIKIIVSDYDNNYHFINWQSMIIFE
jgi:hypothetical protein